VGAGDGGVIALIQRVAEARVRIDGRVVGEIGAGLLAYRVFADAAGKMNLSLRDTGGGLLLVSQFTLAADTNSGTRPSFTPAAAPEVGARLFAHFVAQAQRAHAPVESGEFGAMMRVELVNDGPVTLWLQVKPKLQEKQP
jgi:D-tyrosyl-tRNA(Tyr) deacylase